MADMVEAVELIRESLTIWLRQFSVLAVVMGAALVPMFLLAREIDGDEWNKAAGTAVIAGTFAALATAYKMWNGTEKS